MTSDGDGGLSRRAFLTMSWRRETTPDPSEPARLGQSDDFVLLGSTLSLRDLAVGEALIAPRRADIHAVRTLTGILALRSRCPNDGALVAWRANERSEDTLAPIGRFYCSRDASMFNRLGESVAGPSDAPLPALTVTEIDGRLWVDHGRLDVPVAGATATEGRLGREFPLTGN